MDEKVFMFGPHRNLTGIACVPQPEKRNHPLPAVILLNAGFVHQVGPFRMGVDLCRDLCSAGFMTFRFDLSGIGDSRQTPVKGSQDELVIADIQYAMDLLQKKYEAQEFVIAGLCTGADNAHKAAVHDHRISGIITLDGYAYSTRKSKRNHVILRTKRYISVLTHLKKLKTTLAYRYHKYTSKPQEEFIPVWYLPPYEQSLKDMENFIDRKVNMMMIFSGSMIARYNYQGQVRDMFSSLNFGNLLHESFEYGADHTFSKIEDRKKLLEKIKAWLIRTYIKES